MIHHEKKRKRKKRSFQIKNELPTKLFLAPTIELPDRIIAVDADFDTSARSLLWMPILSLRPDRRTSVIAAIRRTNAWWVFRCVIKDWRWWSLGLGGRGSTCKWLVGEEQKRKNKKNTELEESKKNAVRVSGQWVWVFCSEEQKEEQIKKKRERKKSKE